MKEKELEEIVFTERQTEILELLSKGLRIDVISKELFICKGSLKNQMNQMYQIFDLDMQERYDKRLKLALIGKELFG